MYLTCKYFDFLFPCFSCTYFALFIHICSLTMTIIVFFFFLIFFFYFFRGTFVLCFNRCVCGGGVSTASFNCMKYAFPAKKLLYPPSRDSPHIGSWARISMWISSWIFLKDAKRAFTKPPPSQSGWLTNICAVQHVWRMLKKGRVLLS